MRVRIDAHFCSWAIVIGMCAFAALVIGGLFYTPYYFHQQDAFLVNTGPLYPGSKMTIQRTYCVHIRTSQYISQLTDGFKYAYAPLVYAHQNGCKTVRFQVPVPRDAPPGRYNYDGYHLIPQNWIHDALIGPTVVVEPSIPVMVAKAPEK